MLRDAIKHALEAEAWPEAGRLIKRAASDALDHFELGALRGWLDRLPDPAVLADPELAILKGWVTYFTGQLAASRAIVQTLGDVSSDQLSPRHWARLVSLRATLAVTREDPDVSRLMREALALSSEDDPLFRQYNLLTLGLIQQQFESKTIDASETYQEAIRLGRSLSVPAWTMHAVHDLAFTLIKRARRLEAEALCEAARRDWVDAQGRPFLTGDLLSLPLASSAYDANDLVRARDLAFQGFEARQRLLQGNLHGVECEQILIRVSSGLGDWEAAWRFVRRARQVAHTFPWFARHIARIEADLYLRQGDVETAERWAEMAQVSLGEQPIEKSRVGVSYLRASAARTGSCQRRAASPASARDQYKERRAIRSPDQCPHSAGADGCRPPRSGSPLIASWPKRSVWLRLRVTCAALLTLVRPWRTCCPQSAPQRLPLSTRCNARSPVPRPLLLPRPSRS